MDKDKSILLLLRIQKLVQEFSKSIFNLLSDLIKEIEGKK